MPSHGDAKWRVSTIRTKDDVEKELGIVLNAQYWIDVCDNATNFLECCEFWVGPLISASLIPARTFYNDYHDALSALSSDLENVTKKTPFQIQQKYKWHAGHRSWYPVKTFRVATGKDIIKS